MLSFHRSLWQRIFQKPTRKFSFAYFKHISFIHEFCWPHSVIVFWNITIPVVYRASHLALLLQPQIFPLPLKRYSSNVGWPWKWCLQERQCHSSEAVNVWKSMEPASSALSVKDSELISSCSSYLIITFLCPFSSTPLCLMAWALFCMWKKIKLWVFCFVCCCI